jgi:predicted Zn-dependent protease
MLNKIVGALNKRRDLAGWTVRHLINRGAQVYAVPKQTEAQRTVDLENYRISVLRQNSDADGNPTVGSGEATIVPGGDIETAIERAVLTAGLVSNPIHSLPAPTPIPEIALADANLQKDAAGVTKAIMERMQTSASRSRDVQLTAAECFGEVHTTHLVNSRGIDAEQEATQINIEFVLHSQRGDEERETFTEMRRRQVAGLNIEEEIEQRTRHTLDLFEAGPAPRGRVR